MANLDLLKNPPSILSISPRLRLVFLAFIVIIISLHSFIQYDLRSQFYNSTGDPTDSPPSKADAYITFLSSAEDPWLFTSVRLLLFQLKHYLLTRDPSNREVIVLTTPHIPFEMEYQLRSEGAVIYRHELIDGLPMGRINGDGKFYNETNHGYKDQYTKVRSSSIT